MKKTYLSICLLGISIFASAQTEFNLIGADLIPDEDGFYRAGIDYDFNDDGVIDHIDGCPTDVDFEDYERRDPANVTYELHKESGTQFGYSYKNCMILPKCEQKYVSTLEPALSQGYIQLRPLIDTTDLELSLSYILSPEVRNIQSITMETSGDVHIQPDKRLIPYIIEYSVDGGNTFDFDYYLMDHVQSDEGYRVTYNTDNADFKHIQEVSQSQNVILRFTSNYDLLALGSDKGQYVKVHKISIVADSAVESKVLGTVVQQPIYKVLDSEIQSIKGEIKVYDMAGHFIGQGSTVKVTKGLYIVINEDFRRTKVFVQ